MRAARTIAVVGLSNNVLRPSYGVARHLQSHGCRIIPVHPSASEVLGEKVYTRLSDIPAHVDIVDVFRRAEFTPEIARDAVAIGAGALWLQSGIRSDEARRIAEDAGLPYVEDRCTKIVHDSLAHHERS